MFLTSARRIRIERHQTQAELVASPLSRCRSLRARPVLHRAATLKRSRKSYASTNQRSTQIDAMRNCIHRGGGEVGIAAPHPAMNFGSRTARR